MSVTLLKLTIREDDQSAGKALVAHLKAESDGNQFAAELGKVELRLKIRSQSLPSMTPDQTVTWIKERLKMMLL